MGAKVSVRNETPYTWYYSNSETGEFRCVYPGCTEQYDEKLDIWCFIYLRYHSHYWNSFRTEYNSHKGNPTFTIRESFDRSRIEWHCNTEGSVATCPNYGKQEEDQREEERRRQERLEREQRIQEEIDRESEISREKLSRSREKLRQKQSFKGQVHHHERTQVLHQQIEDDAAAIERNELADVEKKFKELLSKYKITESEDLQDCELEDRIKTLHNELMLQYCRENKLPEWSQFTFDHAVGYEELSLTEKLTILEAVLKLTLQGTTETEDESDYLLHWEKKYEFLFCLVEELYVTNPTLAEPISLRILDAVSELLPKSRETLGQILFNNIWTPTEIMLFIRKASSIDHNQIPQVLHMVQTYRLSCLLTLSALKKQEPLMFLQQQVREDEDKDTDTILRELSESQCPENILTVIEDVLRQNLETELPKYWKKDLIQKDIDDVKMKIKSLDFANPDINTLREVLIGMSVAVQDNTTIKMQDGTERPGYFPRQTQLASLLLLLLSQLTANKGRLLEIGTGEGKSMILAMFATIQAIRGIKVDIVTSSPVLARRDQEEWEKFFKKFGVTSSVVPPPLSKQSSSVEPDKLLEEAYTQQVVYGTVGAFAADTLKQEFERRTTRGTRGFELVIVDEVDYMTLDNGVQVTFLSHEASGLRHMDQILANIWTMTSTCQPIEMLDTGEIKWATRIQHFHKAATSAVMGSEASDSFSAFDILLPGVDLGFFSPEDVETLRQAMSETETENTGDDYQDDGWRVIEQVMKKTGVSQQYDLLSIFQEVMENSVAFECYSEENNKAKRYGTEERHADLEVSMLLLENGLACEIMSEKSLIEATVSAVKSCIKYSDECSDFDKYDNFIIIPHFLREYVENQLPVFVENALRAIEMTQGREYMIDISQAAAKVSASDPDKHQYDAIIPVDFKASGVLEKNKKWGNGLQQFLEMKHQLAISPLSSVTNYMSNFHYFKRYIHGNGIFGVSGTLGGDAERDFLERHYGTKSYTIPAHRHKKVVELPALQVNGGNDQWIQTVCDTTWKAASRGQVVLVICEDVKTANELHVKMQDEERFKPHQITMYTISERHNIEKDTFSGGRIIIATNLGGRGTDIKVKEKVNECGGLFVLLTHFSRNRRVEKQIVGRTARKGNPGMVQMVLNQDHLAPAYQGQSVEIMRQLREEYEVKRISEMESDELVEIDLKEKLFSTFCQSLVDFDQEYKKIQNKQKFDYQPALNALKEAWALWLTLHEEHINRHDDIHDLQADLIKTMNETKGKLLQGESDNFYDHIKQAILRTDKHCRNKTNDYGAKSCWQKAANSDPLYKAVALYNQAYITINLAKGDYKAEARELLEQAKKSVGVYISETSNTMVSCQMSVTDKLKPHSKTSNNFQSQMEARMNIFKSWKTYIDNALKKLVELEKDKSDAITEECSVYMLLEEKDFIITNELMALYELGLAIVFEVKKKPKFCFDALICFFIGVIQVLAGILVCAFSFGTASQIGLSLISEGVSDMINGIEGMVKGAFDWVQWAISKSISIGISLLTAGFSAIKKAVTAVYKVTKSLLNGTKSFSFVARDIIKSGKHVFSSIKGTAQSAISSVGKQTFGSAMKKMATSTVVKQNFKHAAKYAAQEIGKQAVVTVLNHAIDEGLKEAFKKILDSAFTDVVTSAVKQNRDLDKAITEFICSQVPKAAMQKDNFKIGKLDEEEMTKTIAVLAEEVIPDLMMRCTTVHDVISGLSKVCNGAIDINKGKYSDIIKGFELGLKIADYTTHLIEIRNSVPTKRVIDETFVPTLLKDIEELQQDAEKYDQDGRHNLQDVQRLKDKILSTLADSVSQSFIKACSGHMTSFLTKTFKSELNDATGEAVGKILGRHKTQSFFDDQRHKHNMRSASHRTEKSLTEKERMDLMDYMEHISNVDHPATGFDIIVLTRSGLLNGRGIRLTVIDKHGNRLSEEHYKGTDKSAGNITLQLTKVKELQPPGKSSSQQIYSGHFDIVQDDGTVVNVNSEHQNSLYHAITQATGSDQSDLKGAAVKLREKVKNEVQDNLASYARTLKLQRGYDQSHKNPGKYAIIGGAKPGGASHSELLTEEEYLKSTSSIKPGECDIIRSYKLASVEKYKRLIDARQSKNSGTVNADHVPPKDSIRKAWERTKDKPELQEQLKNSNPKLYEMIESIKDDNNGRNLIAMEVLAKDHKRALTTASSHQAKKCRELLAESLVSGDVETMLKQSMIVAHPLTSQELMADLGENRRPPHNEMSKEGIRGYYKAGYTNLVTVYSRQGLINQNQKDQLMEWVNQDKHEDKNTPEYLSIRNSLQ